MVRILRGGEDIIFLQVLVGAHTLLQMLVCRPKRIQELNRANAVSI